MKKFTLYLDNPIEGCLNTYIETKKAIERDDEIINTTSLANLSFELVEQGYKIFVVCGGNHKEFFPGMTGSNGKQIRYEHNLERLLKGGCFDFKDDNQTRTKMFKECTMYDPNIRTIATNRIEP